MLAPELTLELAASARSAGLNARGLDPDLRPQADVVRGPAAVLRFIEKLPGIHDLDPFDSHDVVDDAVRFARRRCAYELHIEPREDGAEPRLKRSEGRAIRHIVEVAGDDGGVGRILQPAKDRLHLAAA